MPESNLSAFLWSVADLLRGDFKQSDYGKVILPFTVLRRLDCVLEPTKAAVLKEYEVPCAGWPPEPRTSPRKSSFRVSSIVTRRPTTLNHLLKADR